MSDWVRDPGAQVDEDYRVWPCCGGLWAEGWVGHYADCQRIKDYTAGWNASAEAFDNLREATA